MCGVTVLTEGMGLLIVTGDVLFVALTLGYARCSAD